MFDKRSRLFNKMNDLDMDNIYTVRKLAEDFIEWCRWNKAYIDIEVIKPKQFDTIIVIHELFDILKAEESWEFLSDIKYILKEYSNHSQEDYDYMIDFWNIKLNELLNY